MYCTIKKMRGIYFKLWTRKLLESTSNNQWNELHIRWYLKEAYKHCEDYTGDSIVQTTCENIKPFIKGTNDLDYSHKCVFENNKCITKQRECGDYDYSKDGNTYYCTRIKFDDNSKKFCELDTDNCIENYLT